MRIDVEQMLGHEQMGGQPKPSGHLELGKAGPEFRYGR
jgi:hypothetical protein